MASRKVERANEDVKRELAMVMRELKDPRVSGVISIVELNLTNDFSHCTVYISSLDGKESAEEAIKGLESASGYIRRELGKKLELRKMPLLHFVADDGIEHSAEIGKMINDLKKAEDEKNAD